eukprot:GHVT01096917.1.p1 GENE.GHVT01096917.1~~GHVT01096917.1.p1  ORF type:complete len:141 (+),score=25.23 GHVT01096917.1:204-626(+)
MTNRTALAFQIFDRDGDGNLQGVEIHQALGAAGVCPSVGEVATDMRNAGSDKVDSAGFTKLVEKYKGSVSSKEELETLFKVIDPKNEGSLDSRSLQFLLTNFGERLSKDEVHEFFEALNVDVNGTAKILNTCAALEKLSK